MAEFDNFSREELKSLLKKNGDSQYDIECKIKRVISDEEECMKMLKDDRKALESLSGGWTGESAEKYILESLEENEMFRKKYIQAFSAEQDRLHNERKKLQNDEQDILDAMADMNDEEK